MTKTKLQEVDLLKSEGATITAEELATLRINAAKVSDLEKSLQDSETLKQELEDLRKAKMEADTIKAENISIKAQLADLEKAKAAAILKEMTDVVKGFNFITDEEQPLVVTALLRSADAPLILTVLEKARVALEAAVTEEAGHSEEGTTVVDSEKSINAVQDILKARKLQQSK